MSKKLILYSAWYCPFAQRTWATLEHLGIPYDYRETDPYNKSPEWMDISRQTGRVPVLEIFTHKEKTLRIPDSLRSMEYLDDIQIEGVDGFSSQAAIRADARYWLDVQKSDIIPYFYRFLKAGKCSSEADQAKEMMLAGLQIFAQAMASEGPYFAGNTPKIVDFAFAPFALRIELLLKHYRGFTMPTNGETWARYTTWWIAMKAHPAFLNTMPDPETYFERLTKFYLPYSQGGGQEDVTKII